MSKIYPDAWVLAKINHPKAGKYLSIVSGYQGSYLGSNSYRISSELRSVYVTEEGLGAETLTGTRYSLYSKALGAFGEVPTAMALISEAFPGTEFFTKELEVAACLKSNSY